MATPSSELPDSWHADWSGLTVTVVGLGEEGFAIADTLAELGASAHVLTTADDGDRRAILDVLGVSVELVGQDRDIPGAVARRAADLVIIAPGWVPDLEVEQRVWDGPGIVWSDVEFAWRVADKLRQRPDVVLIGGGPRATELADVAQVFALHAGMRAARGGVGAPPALDALRHPDGIDALIWSVDSRQLWRMGRETNSARQPRVSVAWDAAGELANQLHEALYTNTLESCVYQPGTVTQRALENASVIEGARAIGIVGGTPGMSDLGRVEGVIVDRAFLPDRKDRALELCTLDELLDAGFRSPEAVELAIAAMAVVRALGVEPEAIGGALQRGGWPDRK